MIWPSTMALTAGIPCTPAAWEMRWLASVSIFASTHLPPSAAASFSRIGDNCRHGPHHDAQKSRTTGTVRDRSTTSVWKVASVTSTTLLFAPSTPDDGAVCRRPPRSTAPDSRKLVGSVISLSNPTAERFLPPPGALLADDEPVQRDQRPGGTRVVLTDDDDLDRVYGVRQLGERAVGAVLRGRRVVVDRRHELAVNEDLRLTLVGTGHGVPPHGCSEEGQRRCCTADVAAGDRLARGTRCGNPAPRHQHGRRRGVRRRTDLDGVDGDV